ncbi:MAG: PKD-like domain-containing protein [Bacteroidia bacterium]
MKCTLYKFARIAASLSLIASTAFAQQKITAPVIGDRTCGTPLLPDEFEDWVNGLQAQWRNANGNSTMAVYTLPVIMHIIHNGEAIGSGTNISVAQANSQITVLNTDYNKLNPDTSLVPAIWKPLVANVQINFCAAQVDPSGNVLASPGIDRINRNTAGFTAPPYTQAYIDATIKPATIWNPNQYLNIWCMSLGGGLLGYATFPNPGTSGLAGLSAPYGSTTTDGVVILNTAFGNTGTAAAPYNLGRTATHEVGHWLGLRHIWGDGACLTDYCNDTPPAAASNGGCPTFPFHSGTCTGNSPNGEMFMNYMDYTNDACMYMFTNDQKTRMQAIMAGSTMRMNLATSTKCSVPFALDAGIQQIINPAPASSRCINSVTPLVTLRNYGSGTLTSCTINYSLDGGANTPFAWTGSLASGNTIQVTMPALSGLSIATHTYVAATTAPNAGTDQNNTNNSSSSTFSITGAPAGSALPFTEGYQTTTFVPAGWSYTPINPPTNQWARFTTTGGFGTSTACAKMDNFSGTVDITGQKDAMITPAISFSAANSTLKLKFDVAYARYNASTSDSLNVWITTDCGGSWTKIYNKGGAPLSTAPDITTAFTPTATQWRTDSVSLSSYAGLSSVKLKFESVSAWGNNLYLDNINLAFTAAAAPPVANFTSAATKCQGQSIAFTDASTNTPTSWAWSATPGAGVTIASATSQNPLITFATAGTYTVTLVATNANGSSAPFNQTITVNAVPVMTSATTKTICTGTAVGLALSSSVPSAYSWIAASNANVTGESTTAQTTATISNTLGNATATTQTVTYSVTPTATTGGCVGTVQTVSVTVNPVPVMTSANTITVCSGTAMSLALASNVPSSYTWMATDNTNTTGESTTAQTGAILNNTIVNTTTTAQTVSYTVTPTSTAGNCTGTPQAISVTVNPAPAMTSSGTATVCSGVALNKTLTSTIASTYSWIAADNVNTTGESLTAQAGSTINNTISNTTATAQTVTYSVTPTATTGGCVGAVQTVTITVNPVPVMSSANTASVCSGSAVNIPLTSNVPSSYSWIAANNASVTGESTTAQATSTINNTLSTASGSVQTVTYSVTPAATTGGCVGAVQTVTVSVVPTPAMTSANAATVCSGSPLNFALTSSVPSSYSWIAANNANTTGESTTAQTGAVITNTLVSTAATAQVVSYTVIPTSTSGSCAGTPQTVSVTVNPTPAMTSAGSATVCSGTALNIGLTSTVPSTYSWIAANNTNTTGESITAQNTATINNTITTTAASPQVVSYTVTPTATTGACAGAPQTVTVTVSAVPTATISGTTAICAGANAALSAAGSTAGSGTIAAYQWQLAGSNIAGATASTYTTSAAGNYNVIVSNSNGCSGTSATTTVTVSNNPTATITGSTTFCSGSNTILSGATSTAGSGTISTYQWQLSGSNIAGATAVTYTATAAGNYNLVVTNSNTCSNTSSAASVTVNAIPTATISGSASFCSGSNTVLSGASSTAGSGTITGYQWQLGGSNIAGATSSTYVATAAGNYNLVVTNSNTCSKTSAVFAVTVNAVPTATISGVTAICAGANATLSAAGSTAGSGTIAAYQWQLAGSNIAGATASTYTTSTAGNYNVIVSNSNGCSATSVTTTVTVSNNPTAAIIGSTTFCSGSSTILSGATSTAGSGTISTYQWQLGGSNIAGATTATYTATVAGTYNLVVTNSNTCFNVSSGTTISVNASPTAVVSGPAGFCAGSNTVLDASSSTAGSGTISTYQWQLSGSNIAGATSATYTATAGGNYNVVVTNSNNCSTASTVSAVTVNANPTANITGAVTFCSGSNTVLDASTSAAGSGSISTYQWELNGSAIAGATSAAYTVTGAGNYDVIITNTNSCSATSVQTPVSVNPLPSVSTAVTDATCTLQGSVTANASGGTGAYNYTWMPSGGTGATESNLNPGTYTVTITDAAGCTATDIATVGNSSSVSATFTQSADQCFNGNNFAFSNTGTTGVTNSWDYGNGSPAATGDNVNYSYPAPGTYTVTQTVTQGICTSSSSAVITVFADPAAPTISQSGNVLTSSAASGNQWYLNGTLIPGETNPAMTITQSGNYTVIVTDANSCTSTSSSFSGTFTGIAESSVISGLSVYPNPNNGMFSISMNVNAKEDLVISLVNAIGQVVFAEQVKDFSGKFNRSFSTDQYGAGVYFLSIKAKNGNVTRRIMVNE